MQENAVKLFKPMQEIAVKLFKSSFLIPKFTPTLSVPSAPHCHPVATSGSVVNALS